MDFWFGLMFFCSTQIQVSLLGGPLCVKTDYIKLHKTRYDYARNLKLDTIVEAPIYILVYIFYNHFSI